MPEKRHMILCTVTDIRDGQVVYPCCSRCCSKLRSDCFEDRWQCLKCGCSSSSEDLEWRYRLSLMVSDGPVLANICLFGSMLENFFGMPSNQFVRFLQKIESMYGNSEEILLLGLKQCFIGHHYYFGVKATATAGKDMTRISLADIIGQKHSACQSTLFSQEDFSSTVAFQMVSAIDRETKTVYEVIRNIFKDSSDETLNNDNICSGYDNLSTMQRSKIGTKLFDCSRSEQSQVTLGQTTALLSCEMSDFENTGIKSASKTRTMSSNKITHPASSDMKNPMMTSFGKNVSKKIEICRRNIFDSKINDTRHLPSRKSSEMKVKCIDDVLGDETDFKESTSMHLKKNYKTRSCSTSNHGVCNEKNENISLKDKLVSKSTDCPIVTEDPMLGFKNYNIAECTQMNFDSEPLFSQDVDSNTNVYMKCTENSQRTKEDRLKNPEIEEKDRRTSLEKSNTSLEGSLLLKNLNVPDLPENIPDSEELDLYLFNDSSFDLESNNDDNISNNQNIMSNNVRQQSTSSFQQNSLEKRKRCKMTQNLDTGADQSNATENQCCQSTDGIVDERQGNELEDNLCGSTSQKKDFEDFDNMFEDTFEDDDKSQHLEDLSSHFDTKTEKTDIILHSKGGTHVHTCVKDVQNRSACEPENDQIYKLVGELVSKKKNSKKEEVKENLDNDEIVIACAPEFSDPSIDDLCHKFDQNLCTNIQTDMKMNQNNLGENDMCDYGEQEILRKQNNSSEKYDDSLNLIFESQQTLSKKEETTDRCSNHFAGGSQSLISESMFVDASGDLFGDSPEMFKNMSGEGHLNRNQGNDECCITTTKSTKKSVKFSRRLSYHKSVQLIDLQMKMNTNVMANECDGKMLKKSCLKQPIETVFEFNEPSVCNRKETNVMQSIENSPILHSKLVPMSQDLFSPSPDISFKKPRNLLSKLINSTKSEKKSPCVNHRHSSTPIEGDTEIPDDEQHMYNSKSFVSMFSDSFDYDYDKENSCSSVPLKKEISRSSVSNFQNSRSLSLFSNSCSLFSNSKHSEKGDNNSCNSNFSIVKGENCTSLYSNNFSCDLFSPSGYESIHSPCSVLPVKRLFLDKM